MITTFKLYETKSTSVKLNLKDIMLSVIDNINFHRLSQLNKMFLEKC